ncbi:hypothetical protein INR49_012399, partial [Caranx melampygus]
MGTAEHYPLKLYSDTGMTLEYVSALLGLATLPQHSLESRRRDDGGRGTTAEVLVTSRSKKFKKVVGKETCSETLESTPSLEKEKFPQDYFPE